MMQCTTIVPYGFPCKIEEIEGVNKRIDGKVPTKDESFECVVDITFIPSHWLLYTRQALPTSGPWVAPSYPVI